MYPWKNNAKDNPCYQCKERHLCCHDSCERHKKFQQEQHDIRYQNALLINPKESRYFKEKSYHFHKKNKFSLQSKKYR